MRPVTETDIEVYKWKLCIPLKVEENLPLIVTNKVSISSEDLKNRSPKLGDMIARNPNNHDDQWLVSKDYFEENFEPLNE